MLIAIIGQDMYVNFVRITFLVLKAGFMMQVLVLCCVTSQPSLDHNREIFIVYGSIRKITSVYGKIRQCTENYGNKRKLIGSEIVSLTIKS